MSAGLAALLIASCEHYVTADVTVNEDDAAPTAISYNRSDIARETCEAQYQPDRQNYLSAAQTILSKSTISGGGGAPLERFRAEVNAAYNSVVMRCKTHMHCLEVNRYNEAACYMSASDRKDAERRFSDLSERLRELESERDARIADSKKPAPSARASVKNSITQSNDQSQDQKNDQDQTSDAHIGHDIESLAVCDNAENLLQRKCRQ